MSVNLFSFVNEAFTKKAWFDYTLFSSVVKKAQRLMDDAVDLEEEKINRIIDKITNDKGPGGLTTKLTELNLWKKIQGKLLAGRRTGLSAIGLGDCLAALNLKYGSDESIYKAGDIYSWFHDSAYDESVFMAKERGAFPVWDKEREKESRHVWIAMTDSIREVYEEYGRRNIALLTVPPTGTLAIMAGITSGIEPVFNLSYTRRRKVDSSDKVAFVDKQGDKWEEYTVYHHKYEEYGKPDSYTGSTAHDLNPFTRVEMQATIQKHIDHSISSTINLPKETTEEEIWDIYMLAWESGCKGITIYREGCREGVLINKKSVKFETHDAPKRPKQLDCKLSYVTVKGEKFCVLVGLFENKPYELFAFNVNKETFLLSSSYKYKIDKVERGKYNLVSEDGTCVYGTITEKLNDEQAAITRLISTSLRHGASIKFIVEQLNKVEGDLTSFTKAMLRVLKLYVEDGTPIKGATCDSCGSTMVMENGCQVCKSCGQSKCS